MQSEQASALGEFELLERVAEGGMGEVWRGRHRRLGLPVAVKLLSGQLAAEERFRDAFRWEVRAVARLGHPAVVALYDVGVAPDPRAPGGVPYLVMEYLPGGSLRPHCGQLGWRRVRAILLTVLDALAHAHARGIVHRDLKPGNLLLTADGETVKLTDFGVSYPIRPHPEAPVLAAGGLVGTPSYMAPEQIRSGIIDIGPWTDLYGLGCLAWRLSFGRAVFAGGGLMDVLRAQTESPPPAVPDPSFGPAGYEGWLHRLLAKVPEARFQSAADAAWALLELDPGGGGRGALEPPFATTWSTWLSEATVVERVELGTAPDGLPGAANHPPVPLPASWRRAGGEPSEPDAGGGGLELRGLREPPFRGRVRERDALWASLAEVVAGGVVRTTRISGAAGSGKTRLAEWLAERASEVGAARVVLSTNQPERSPGDGLRAGLLRALGVEQLRDEARRARLRVLADAAGWSDVTRRSVEVALCDEPRPPLPPRAVAYAHTLRALAAVRPLVVLIDDAHWAPDELDVVNALLSGPDVPVMLLVVWEPELTRTTTQKASLARLRGPRATLELDLGSLPRVEEAVRRPSRGAATVGPARSSLVVGALLGECFARETWSAACAAASLPAGAELLAEWSDAGLVRLEPDGRHVRLASRELREALCAEQRAELHLACAEALAGARAIEQVARRGRHLAAAGRGSEAAEVLLVAASRSRAAGDYEQGRQLLVVRARALRAEGATRLDRRWLEGRLLYCRLLRAQGRAGLALRLSRQSARMVEEAGLEALRPRALFEAGAALRLVGGLLGAVTSLRTAFEAAEEAKDVEVVAAAGEALVLTLRGLHRLGTAQRLIDHLLGLSPRIVDDATRANLHYMAGLVAVSRGRLDEGARWARESFARLEALGDHWGVARSRLVLADLARLRGDLATAEAECFASLETFTALGVNDGMFALSSLATLARLAGDLDLARLRVEEAVGMARKADRVGPEGLFRAVAATVYAAQGDWGAATSALLDARAILERVGFANRDVAEDLETCAEAAAGAGQRAVARLAREFAAAQWRTLAEPARASGAEPRSQ